MAETDNAPDAKQPVTSRVEKEPDTHDFRDRGNPMVKVYPPNHWSRVGEREERFDPARGCRW